MEIKMKVIKLENGNTIEQVNVTIMNFYLAPSYFKKIKAFFGISFMGIRIPEFKLAQSEIRLFAKLSG